MMKIISNGNFKLKLFVALFTVLPILMVFGGYQSLDQGFIAILALLGVFGLVTLVYLEIREIGFNRIWRNLSDMQSWKIGFAGAARHFAGFVVAGVIGHALGVPDSMLLLFALFFGELLYAICRYVLCAFRKLM